MKINIVKLKRCSNFIIVIFLTTLIVWVYRKALSISFAQDDFVFLNRVAQVKSVKDFVDLFLRSDHFYRPFPRVAFLLAEYSVFGKYAYGYHATNIVIHILNSLLLIKIVQRFINNSIIYFGTGLFYAIHPIHYLSILWISGIQELLVVFGLLLSLYLVILHIERHSYIWYIFALISFSVALLSKEIAVIFPVWLIIVISRYNLSIQTKIRILTGFVVLVIFYFILYQSKSGVDTNNGPYSIRVNINVFLINIRLYLLDTLGLRTAKIELNKILIVFMVFVGFILLVIREKYYRWLMLLGLSWFVSALLPIIFLSSHNYSYYLSVSWIGGSLILALILNYIVSAVKLTKSTWEMIIKRIILISMCLLWYFHAQKYIEHQWNIDVGGIRMKSQLSTSIMQNLQNEYPTLPINSKLYIRNVSEYDINASGRESMFTFFYPSLQQVIFENRTVISIDELKRQKIYIFEYKQTSN